MAFSITLDCPKLSEFQEKLDAELNKLRIKSQKQHLIGRWRQKDLKSRVIAAQMKYAATFVR